MIDDMILRLVEGIVMASRGRMLDTYPTAVDRSISTDEVARRSGFASMADIHVHDVRASELIPQGLASWLARRAYLLEGTAASGRGFHRTLITHRQFEVRPFTTAQIELLETFTDQAVIAIENVRIFKNSRSRWSSKLRRARSWA